MNPNPELFETPASPRDPAPAPAPAPAEWRRWIRRLLVCNPFFLASAALLLLAVNRLSTDDRLFTAELPNLLFNFFSLHAYELVVIGTALVLVRRRVLYDSALLVVLDHGLALVPFMLISQATLEGINTAIMLVFTGAALVVARATAVQRRYPQFNLPPRSLALGAVLLAANIALPLFARPVMERQVQDWALYDPLLWLGILPLLAAGANLVPRPTIYGGTNPQRHWLPLFIYGLWLLGSAVHAWCVGHICDVPFSLSNLAPITWVCAWSLQRRLTDCLRLPSGRLRAALFIVTAAVPLMAAGHPTVFLTLASANFIGFATLWLRTPEDRFLRNVLAHLMLVSFTLAIAAVPLGSALGIQSDLSWFTRERWIGIAGVLYVVILSIASRRAEVALVAAFVIGLAVVTLRPGWAHPGFQVAAAFLIASSLRWNDRAQPGAAALRWLAGIAWMFESIGSVRSAVGIDPAACAAGLVVLTFWIGSWWRHGVRQSGLVPAGACTAIAANPITWCVFHSSVGIVAMAASLALFAAGTGLAWNRRTEG